MLYFLDEDDDDDAEYYRQEVGHAPDPGRHSDFCSNFCFIEDRNFI